MTFSSTVCTRSYCLRAYVHLLTRDTVGGVLVPRALIELGLLNVIPEAGDGQPNGLDRFENRFQALHERFKPVIASHG